MKTYRVYWKVVLPAIVGLAFGGLFQLHRTWHSESAGEFNSVMQEHYTVARANEVVEYVSFHDSEPVTLAARNGAHVRWAMSAVLLVGGSVVGVFLCVIAIMIAHPKDANVLRSKCASLLCGFVLAVAASVIALVAVPKYSWNTSVLVPALEGLELRWVMSWQAIAVATLIAAMASLSGYCLATVTGVLRAGRTVILERCAQSVRSLGTLLGIGSTVLVLGAVEMYYLFTWGTLWMLPVHRPLGEEVSRSGVVAMGAFFTVLLIIVYGLPRIAVRHVALTTVLKEPITEKERGELLSQYSLGNERILSVVMRATAVLAPFFASLLSDPVGKLLLG